MLRMADSPPNPPNPALWHGESMAFKAIISKEGRFYVARAVDLDVTSQGESQKEAIANLQEAIELYLEYAEPEDLGGMTREEFIRLQERK